MNDDDENGGGDDDDCVSGYKKRSQVVVNIFDEYDEFDYDQYDDDGHYDCADHDFDQIDYDDKEDDDYVSGCKKCSQVLVIVFLLAGLAWSIVGFLWIFGVSR